MIRLEYFGTNLTEHGHYRWLVGEHGLEKMWLKFDDLPFHPERLTNKMKKGEAAFYQGGGYTVIAFAGSPTDQRPGCMSVFWIKATITHDELNSIIMSNKTCRALIGWIGANK